MTKIHSFSSHELTCNSLWLILGVLKELIWTIFAHVLTAFMEEVIFKGPYSAIYADHQYVAL